MFSFHRFYTFVNALDTFSTSSSHLSTTQCSAQFWHRPSWHRQTPSGWLV
jgi:hypothetical protein